MKYSIELSQKSVKFLDKMKKKDKTAFQTIIAHLIRKSQLIIFVIAIGHRKDIYNRRDLYE